ncbi:protein of unknown function [Methylocaldum szegediense]|uniref:Uncharacterized protein n=1 Tax=Methylocaldum szegediense TaxID=73780 RepID=A0ABM9HWW1_9GAMM|nr:protein of unknown function [Methylocaldum szegediense]
MSRAEHPASTSLRTADPPTALPGASKGSFYDHAISFLRSSLIRYPLSDGSVPQGSNWDYPLSNE